MKLCHVADKGEGVTTAERVMIIPSSPKESYVYV